MTKYLKHASVFELWGILISIVLYQFQEKETMTFLRKTRAVALALVALATPVVAQAQAITPTGVFGPQTGMNFNPLGPSGIPNHAVMVNGNMRNLTLGLTAHQRLTGPNLLNNGNGVFYASAGAPFSSNPTYASWNVGLYVGGSGVALYDYKYFYDFLSASGNMQSTHGVVAFSTPVKVEDSWNMGMSFLGSSGGGITPPVGMFDPNAAGEYTFALAAYDKQTGLELSRTAIQVNVSSVVPEPSTYALMAAGLAGLGFVARRRRSALVS